MTVSALYRKHRQWALGLAKDGDDEDHLTALIVLWKAAREYDGEGDFRSFARAQIEEALAREAV